jgi:hypothetical protein
MIAMNGIEYLWPIEPSLLRHFVVADRLLMAPGVCGGGGFVRPREP